ncbi:MAG: TM2 domain-containing protein [Saprospiraceae bacterium]|nr:TM2 domain-containing protein [Saprospiraceae bacterium]
MKNKTTAAFLSLILGVFGVQFFYVGRIGLGIFMNMLTFFAGKPQIAAFVGFVNFILFLVMSQNDFDKKYNKQQWKEQQRQGNDYQAQQEAQRQAQQEAQQRAQYEAQQNREARARMRPTAPPQYQKPQKQNKPSISQKESLKQSALAKFKDFDYQGAIDDFGKALAIEPTDLAVHWNLACCYSLTEQKELAFYHLQKSVELGFKDYDKIKSHEALAFLRVQSEFETFARNGFKMTEEMEHSDILQQLKDLTQRREHGLLTEKEFAEMSRKLTE